jgi:hypothetical protein
MGAASHDFEKRAQRVIGRLEGAMRSGKLDDDATKRAIALLEGATDEARSLRTEAEAAKAEAARYRFIRSQMEVGAVQTQLPLCRSLFWVGTYVDCSSVSNADDAIDAAIAAATGSNT